MRLPILVAHEIRARKLIAPRAHVLVALSGGPDSVALFHCLLELARKRDLVFTLSAAHLHHGLRGADADRDERFCIALCDHHGVPLIHAHVDTPALARQVRKSHEETARIARHAFLAAAAAAIRCHRVAVAHHADDRIETVLYRLCRGTGLAGLQGIGWTGPLQLDCEPDVTGAVEWRGENAIVCAASASILSSRSGARGCQVVRPLLGCSRAQILAYLGGKHQSFCTDETNFDVTIPRNAIRQAVLPLLEEKVHPGARAALWRLAEESEVFAERRAWRREWLAAFAGMGLRENLALPVSRDGLVPEPDELSDALAVLQTMWHLAGAAFTLQHAHALQSLFRPHSGPKRIDLPSGVVAERRGKTVTIYRKA